MLQLQQNGPHRQELLDAKTQTDQSHSRGKGTRGPTRGRTRVHTDVETIQSRKSGFLVTDVAQSWDPRPTYKSIHDNLMSVNTQSNTQKRPMVITTIGNKRYKMLYDTGSCITCMSTETLNELQNENVHVKRINAKPKEFTSANGGKLRSAGIYEFRFNINDKEIRYPFHVLPRLHEKFILGIDFISKHELNLCLRHQQFHWESKCPLDHESSLAICEETTIPPGKTQLCQVRIKRKENDEKHVTMITEVRSIHKPWIQGAPTLVETDQQDKVKIEIHNASLVPRVLARNEEIGWAEPIQPNDLLPLPEPISGIETTEENTTLSKQQRQFIDENAKIEGDTNQKHRYLKEFYKFPQVFSLYKNDLGRCQLIQHEILLKTKEPVYIKQFKIPEGHQQAVKDQVKEWLKLGIVQTTRSRYNSPIFVVKKKDGSFRLVQDFRALNQQTYIDKYSMRDVTDCIHEIGRSGSTIFSTIDLTSGFWQMVLEPKSRPLTAFTVYGM